MFMMNVTVPYLVRQILVIFLYDGVLLSMLHAPARCSQHYFILFIHICFDYSPGKYALPKN